MKPFKKLTEFYPVATVHVEGLITLVDLPVQGVEHETVRTQLFRGDSVIALVVLVALLGVFELAELLRARESCA